MSDFEEVANSLIKRIDAALALGESSDALCARQKNDPDLELDCRIFIHELGNLPLWKEVEDARFAELPRLRSLLEKVPGIVALRRQEGD